MEKKTRMDRRTIATNQIRSWTKLAQEMVWMEKRLVKALGLMKTNPRREITSAVVRA